MSCTFLENVYCYKFYCRLFVKSDKRDTVFIIISGIE
jgi:hypothetical protein